MNDQNPVLDPLIDEALEQRPIAPLPPGFVNQVMARIQAVPEKASRKVIRFRLELLDTAMPVLAACLVVLALGLTGQLVFLDLAAPVNWSMVLPSTIFSQPTEWSLTNSNWVGLIGLLTFAEICLGILFCLWHWEDRPLILKETNHKTENTG